MSIFSRIKDAIFGAGAKAAPQPTPPRPSPPPGVGTTAQKAPAPAPAPAPASTPPMSAVDVDAVLQQLAAKQSQQLNWRTSIVDLMKLLGIDSSLENRKELARELGYKEDMSDSAAMNIWLHKAVMKQLAAHGGKVPPQLKD